MTGGSEKPGAATGSNRLSVGDGKKSEWRAKRAKNAPPGTASNAIPDAGMTFASRIVTRIDTRPRRTRIAGGQEADSAP